MSQRSLLVDLQKTWSRSVTITYEINNKLKQINKLKLIEWKPLTITVVIETWKLFTAFI